MDHQFMSVAAALRAMTSQEAATWLLDRYPIESKDYGEVFALMTRRSWKRPDQVRLATYYLHKIPFATPTPYEAFASFMSLRTLIPIIVDHWPHDEHKVDLLLYFLHPILNRIARSDADRRIIEALPVIGRNL